MWASACPPAPPLSVRGPGVPAGSDRWVLTDPWAVLSVAGLEVCQFSRDASVAEAWLIAQEPYLASRDFGHTVDSVEKLIKRHEAFEKSTAGWAERFAALEKPTTVSREARGGGQPRLGGGPQVKKSSAVTGDLRTV